MKTLHKSGHAHFGALRIVLLGGLSLALSGMSILCCYVFGTHLAPGVEGQLYGVLGGVADAMKAVLPIGIAAALSASQRGKAFAALAVFIVFSAYSFTSELGLYALSRDAVAGNARAGQEGYDTLKAERARIAARLKELGSQRPAGAVKGDLAAARQSRLWAQSGECKDATAAATRTFCASYERLQGELAGAEEAERLRADDANLAQKLSGFDLAAVLKSADPQSEALARFTGLAPATVRDALAVLVAVLIELGSGLGLWIATAGLGAAKTPSAAQPAGGRERASSSLTKSSPAKPADPVKQFLKTLGGQEETAADLHRAFHAWAESNGADMLSAKALGARLVELGYVRSRRGGVVRYAKGTLRPKAGQGIRLAVSNG